MTKIDRLKKRFLSKPKDFSWDELTKLLKSFGYALQTGGKTGGSKRKFIDDEGVEIRLHEPHPGKILKQYQMREIIKHLEKEGHI